MTIIQEAHPYSIHCPCRSVGPPSPHLFRLSPILGVVPALPLTFLGDPGQALPASHPASPWWLMMYHTAIYRAPSGL